MGPFAGPARTGTDSKVRGEPATTDIYRGDCSKGGDHRHDWGSVSVGGGGEFVGQSVSGEKREEFMGFVRSFVVTSRPLRGPANTTRAQGPKWGGGLVGWGVSRHTCQQAISLCQPCLPIR